MACTRVAGGTDLAVGRAWFVLLALLAGGVATSGCRKEAEAPREVTLEGRLEKIDLAKREVTVRYRPKDGAEEVLGVGAVTDETVITINDQPATLSDLREGEFARGTVRSEQVGNEKRRIVVSIRVERATPVGEGG